MQLLIDLPPRDVQIAFNRKRWAELLNDGVLARLPYRIETNAHGNILMTPPASGGHSFRQTEILFQLKQRLTGKPLIECPISNIDGVRVADAAWYSTSRFAQVHDQIAFETAPEICVEVLSPSNTGSEMEEKKSLYFEAGAEEVRFCDENGRMQFFLKADPKESIEKSQICTDFPREIR